METSDGHTHSAHEKGLDKQPLGATMAGVAYMCNTGGGVPVQSGVEPEQVRCTQRHPRLFRATRSVLLVVLVVTVGALFFRFGTESENPKEFWDCVYLLRGTCIGQNRDNLPLSSV